MLCPVCHAPNPDNATICSACGTPLASLEPSVAADSQGLAPRTALRGGAFVIEELLGAGGFGLTYHARESGLSREVAIKEFFPYGSTRQNGRVVPPMGVSEADWRRELEAFREEALTLARFSHPAIVRAYAVWAENGTAYFAMEFLRGESLQKRLNSGYPIPTDEALQIVEHIGQALARVHETGLLHRDIKPDNILLCSGRAVLIDFGTARSFAADKTTPMTQMLTPGYAPLEQYGRRARFGPFTDVYALAATLYHALSGQAPPPSPDRAAGVDLRPLDELNPAIAPSLARAVEAALEISVPRRPPTVAAWLEMLRHAAAPPPPPKPVTVPPPSPPTVAPAQQSAPVAPQYETSPYTVPAPQAPTPAVPRPRTPPPPSTVADDVALELPPEARTPKWFWPVVFGVPVLLLAWWLLRDPIRGDLRDFNAQIVPVLRAANAVQSSYTGPNAAKLETLQASVTSQGIPAEQQVLTSLNRLSPSSEEARFSRDQLIDAEQARLEALQQLASSGDNPNSALDALRSADRARAIWTNDYNYLMRQHRLR